MKIILKPNGGGPWLKLNSGLELSLETMAVVFLVALVVLAAVFK